MSSKILVLGGSGFLGKHICLSALNAGHNVVSISRRGMPDITGDSFPVSALSGISWKKGDVFDINTYKNELKDASAVVHSMGTIFDDPRYKTLMNGSGMNGLLGLPAFIASQLAGSNPLRPNSFDIINRKSAVLLANSYSESLKSREKAGRRPFIYISAEDWNPLIDRRYIESKRAAETAIDSLNNLRGVYLRPGFMYDDKSTTPDARYMLGKALNTLNCAIGGHLPDALPVQIIAQSVIEAIDDDTIEGVIPLEALKRYTMMRRKSDL